LIVGPFPGIMAMADPIVRELLQLTQRLLDSIAAADWNTYQELSDPALTAFEPEARGQLVEGLPFHQFYFQLGSSTRPRQTTMCSPRVRVFDDVAVVAYVRLNQIVAADGAPQTVASEETRIWRRTGGAWRQFHFHRSAIM
jgi:ketosteroid isomerase-like protein